MRVEFDKRGWLLTAAVSAGSPTVEEAYDVPAISKYMSLQCSIYNLHPFEIETKF